MKTTTTDNTTTTTKRRGRPPKSNTEAVKKPVAKRKATKAKTSPEEEMKNLSDHVESLIREEYAKLPQVRKK